MPVAMDELPDETTPPPADHLRYVKPAEKLPNGLLPAGALLLMAAALLTVYAPSALWFLAYPVLILAALAALFAGLALLLRNL
jgi:hypothetical protein